MKPVKFDNYLVEWANILDGINRLPNANCKSYIREVAKADLKIEDKVDNVLLANTKVTRENQENLRAASEFIENYENGVVENYSERYTTSICLCGKMGRRGYCWEPQ